MKKFCLVCLILLLCVLMTPALAENAGGVAVTNSVTIKKNGVVERQETLKEIRFLSRTDEDYPSLCLTFNHNIDFFDFIQIHCKPYGCPCSGIIKDACWFSNPIYFVLDHPSTESKYRPIELNYQITPLSNRCYALSLQFSDVWQNNAYEVECSVAYAYNEQGVFIYGEDALAQAGKGVPRVPEALDRAETLADESLFVEMEGTTYVLPLKSYAFSGDTLSLRFDLPNEAALTIDAPITAYQREHDEPIVQEELFQYRFDFATGLKIDGKMAWTTEGTSAPVTLKLTETESNRYVLLGQMTNVQIADADSAESLPVSLALKVRVGFRFGKLYIGELSAPMLPTAAESTEQQGTTTNASASAKTSDSTKTSSGGSIAAPPVLQTPKPEKCSRCYGSGDCQTCHGSGDCNWCYGSGTNSTTLTKCSKCSGSGKCTTCRGSGKCTSCGGSGKK